MKYCYLLFILFILGSWKNEINNINTWFIKICKKEIANYSNSSKGLTVFIDSTQLKDTIFIKQNLCGNCCRNGTTTIILKNEKDSIINTCVTENKGWGYESGMPINIILNAIKLNPKLKLFLNINEIENGKIEELQNEFYCYVSKK